ncbi:unnamed protein product [Polarella glacialis]|uniref:Uncharacterized protein n=1 Tax=Polarella glacialis TaxID=89957 RepID=A0A813H5K3_POLGL|nr:unnamed protein product [Polarella glacialis]
MGSPLPWSKGDSVHRQPRHPARGRSANIQIRRCLYPGQHIYAGPSIWSPQGHELVLL